jgi:hypothetical protein
MTLDIDDVVGRMSLALREALGADLPILRGYAQAKARAVAQYAKLIADAYAAGQIDDGEMKRDLDEIEHMTRRFARGFRGVAGATAERAARDAVAALFGALRAGLSFAGAPLPTGLRDRTA